MYDIADEHVAGCIGVATDQTTGPRGEHDVSPSPIGRRDQPPPFGACLPALVSKISRVVPEARSAYEHVLDAVGVPRHEVGGVRRKRDVEAVGGQGRVSVEAIEYIGLAPVAADRDPFRDTRLSIVDEDVGGTVRVARHQVRRM